MIINGQEFLIGADPEVFIRRKDTKEFVSAHGMLPGDKDNPFPVLHGAIQVDGMAAEFNIDPARTKYEFIRNVKSVMNSIRAYIGDEYELVAIPTCHFGKELIDAQPEEAKILGCDPDFDAWTGDENPIPDVDMPFRTGAGHIHIGWTEGQDPKNADHLQVCRHLIQHLDYFTLPTLLVDKDTERRKLYGNAGAFRPKPYGVEYRTPSNFWVASEQKMGMMYDMIKHTLKELTSEPQTQVQRWNKRWGVHDTRNEMRKAFGGNTHEQCGANCQRVVAQEIGGAYVRQL